MNTTNNNTRNSLSASVSKHAARRAMNMKFRSLIAVVASLLGASQIHAANAILVANRYSNSIEQFTTGGAWVRTFATTGRYAPSSVAQSPVTGEIFVTTLIDNSDTTVILRYKPDGTFDVNWDQFQLQCPYPSPPYPPLPYPCFSPATESLLFDAAGNLWVATAYGLPQGDPFSPIYIFKFPAAALTGATPAPLTILPIMASMWRGDQMTFDNNGNLCIAGFIDQDVQCFNTSTQVLVKSYKAALSLFAKVFGSVIEPMGVAFDSSNRMYVSSVFTGEVAHETTPGGAIVPLASGLISPPNLLNGNLTLIGDELYVPTFYYPAPTPGTPDSIDVVSTGGIVSPFISGGAPPLLGNAHLWGAQWVAFVDLPPTCLSPND
jgi:hypothetical protein